MKAQNALDPLARRFLEVSSAWDVQDITQASTLADTTLADLRLIADEQPVAFGVALELIADLRCTVGRALRRDSVDGEVFLLYREGAESRVATPLRRSYDVGIAALKAAQTALHMGDRASAAACFRWAEASDAEFPARMARRALSCFAALEHDYRGALDQLGSLESWPYASVDYPASLLFAVGRYHEAAKLWDQVEDRIEEA